MMTSPVKLMEQVESGLSENNQATIRVEDNEDSEHTYDGDNGNHDCDNGNHLKTDPKKKVLLTMQVTRYLAVIKMLDLQALKYESLRAKLQEGIISVKDQMRMFSSCTVES